MKFFRVLCNIVRFVQYIFHFLCYLLSYQILAKCVNLRKRFTISGAVLSVGQGPRGTVRYWPSQKMSAQAAPARSPHHRFYAPNTSAARRIFSISMERWSSPLPDTLKQSVESVSSTVIPTFTSSSFSSLALMWRLVTYLPDLPAKGDLLTMKFMLRVGSSM